MDQFTVMLQTEQGEKARCLFAQNSFEAQASALACFPNSTVKRCVNLSTLWDEPIILERVESSLDTPDQAALIAVKVALIMGAASIIMFLL